MSEKSKQKTVQQKLSDLNELVAWFQSDEFVLEKAVDTYKTAEKLAEEIESDLESIKNDIQVIKKRFDKED